MAVTRVGLGGPSAAYPGFVAKEAAVSTLHAHADIIGTAVTSETVIGTYVVSEDVIGIAVTSADTITGTI